MTQSTPPASNKGRNGGRKPPALFSRRAKEKFAMTANPGDSFLGAVFIEMRLLSRG